MLYQLVLFKCFTIRVHVVYIIDQKSIKFHQFQIEVTFVWDLYNQNILNNLSRSKLFFADNRRQSLISRPRFIIDESNQRENFLLFRRIYGVPKIHKFRAYEYLNT